MLSWISSPEFNVEDWHSEQPTWNDNGMMILFGANPMIIGDMILKSDHENVHKCQWWNFLTG